MIDAKKVSTMARLAIYEQGQGREDKKMHRYSRRTYLGIRRLISFISVTISYILMTGLYCLRYIDDIFSQGFGYDYRSLLIHLTAAYLLVIAAGMIITEKINRKRYNEMIENLKRYDYGLYQLGTYTEDEEVQQ